MDLTIFINQICVLLFIATQIWSAVTDMKRYEIPNAASFASVLLFVPFALTTPADIGVGASVLLAIGVLAVGFIAFSVGAFGGGDAKLLTGVALWAGLPFFWETLLYIAGTGGVLAVAYMIIHMIRKSTGKTKARLGDVKLPYGVAIACGGIVAAIQHLLPYNTWLLKNGI
jgi:prepilin peptidase CpaA